MYLRDDVRAYRNYHEGLPRRRTGLALRTPEGAIKKSEEGKISAHTAADLHTRIVEPVRMDPKTSKGMLRDPKKETAIIPWRFVEIQEVTKTVRGEEVIEKIAILKSRNGRRIERPLEDIMVPPTPMKLLDGLDMILALGIKDSKALEAVQASVGRARTLSMDFVAMGMQGSDTARFFPHAVIAEIEHELTKAGRTLVKTVATDRAPSLLGAWWQTLNRAFVTTLLYGVGLVGNVTHWGSLNKWSTDDALTTGAQVGLLPMLDVGRVGARETAKRLGSAALTIPRMAVIAPQFISGRRGNDIFVPHVLTKEGIEAGMKHFVPNAYDVLVDSKLRKLQSKDPKSLMPEEFKNPDGSRQTVEQFLVEALRKDVFDTFQSALDDIHLRQAARIHRQEGGLAAYVPDFLKPAAAEISQLTPGFSELFNKWVSRSAAEIGTEMRFELYYNLRRAGLTDKKAGDALHSSMFDWSRPLPENVEYYLGSYSVFLQAKFEAWRHSLAGVFQGMDIPLDEYFRMYARGNTKAQRYEAAYRVYHQALPALTGEVLLPEAHDDECVQRGVAGALHADRLFRLA